jgi:putative transposase
MLTARRSPHDPHKPRLEPRVFGNARCGARTFNPFAILHSGERNRDRAQASVIILRGVPGHVRSDNGPEFVARAVQEWIAAVGAKTPYIQPGSPWQNGYVESFNARVRDELLDGEIFYTLREAKIVIESWRRHYNAIRPHASLSYRAPTPEVFVPALAAWSAAQLQSAAPATLLLPTSPSLN